MKTSKEKMSPKEFAIWIGVGVAVLIVCGWVSVQMLVLNGPHP